MIGAGRAVTRVKIAKAAEYGLGNALRFTLTGGERNDITQAEALLERLEYEHMIADKGYDADALVRSSLNMTLSRYPAAPTVPARP